MRKQLSLLVVALCLCVQSYGQTSDWETYKNEAFQFRADYPGEPKQSEQLVPTAVGDVTMTMFTYNVKMEENSEVFLYMTSFTEYPVGDTDWTDEENAKKVLNGTLNGAASNVKGTIEWSEEGLFNGYNTVKGRIIIPESKLIIHMYNVLVDNKLYLMQVLTKENYKDLSIVSQFFESFELIKIKG